MTAITPPPGRASPGGRTARTRVAVRDATLAELAEHGYAGLTVEAVAQRSGVHKTTVYRRWGGVDGLIVDALDLAGEDEWQPPDTGSLEEDLRGLVREVDTFTDPVGGAASAAFVFASFHSDRGAEALRGFFAVRHERSARVVLRAVRRGELAAGTDAGAVVRAAVAPLYYRLFISREPIDETIAEQAVAAAVAAARSDAFSARGRRRRRAKPVRLP